MKVIEAIWDLPARTAQNTELKKSAAPVSCFLKRRVLNDTKLITKDQFVIITKLPYSKKLFCKHGTNKA